jgi:hypothetical protein
VGHFALPSYCCCVTADISRVGCALPADRRALIIFLHAAKGNGTIGPGSLHSSGQRGYDPEAEFVHHSALKPGVNQHQFEQAIRTAEEQGWGATCQVWEQHFLKGIKGARAGQYVAVWENLWESLDHPRSK